MTTPNAPPALRWLTAADAGPAAELDRGCMARPWSLQSWSAMLCDPLVFGFAAELDGALTAVALGCCVAGEGEILVVAVVSQARRRGIASALVGLILDEARKRGAERVFLEVGADNAPAVALYRSLGFIDAGRRSGYYGAGREGDALLLVHGSAVDAAPGRP